jgi:hypothetical protein
MMTALRLLATLFAMAAAYLIMTAFSMHIGVPAAQVPGSGEFLPPQFDGVANIALMHGQAMLFHLGIGAAIVSAVFMATAAIVGTLLERAKDDS